MQKTAFKTCRCGAEHAALSFPSVCEDKQHGVLVILRQDECAFSVIYGDEFECLDLMAATPEEANIWVTGLTHLAAKSAARFANAPALDDQNGNGAPNKLQVATLRERFHFFIHQLRYLYHIEST